MTQEEKQLLLKDLCARLPYGVIVTDNRHGNSRITEIDIVEKTVYCDDFDEYVELDKWKPYLRPMSSMTKVEYKEMQMVLGRGEFAVLMNKTNGLELWLESVDTDPTIWFDSLVNVQDWLNKKMFAYRTIYGKDMFELGLALEAPEGMYQ